MREVRDVDDGGFLLWIPDSKTEAGRRQIDVPVQLAPLLRRLTRGRLPQAPLFAHTVTRVRPQDWAREQVWRLCKLAGVPEVTPQGLRGTLATLGREVNRTSQEVADMLGHASPQITESAYIDRQRAGAADRAAAWRALEGAHR
jgi:integrase